MGGHLSGVEDGWEGRVVLKMVSKAGARSRGCCENLQSK